MALSVQDESLHSTGVPCEVCVQWTPPVKVGVYLYQWDLNDPCCWDPKGNSTVLP